MSDRERRVRRKRGPWWRALWESRRAVCVLTWVNMALVLAGVPLVQHFVPSCAAEYSWGAMLFLLGSMGWTYWPFLRPFGRYLLGHLGQTAIFTALLLLCWGLIGMGLGIPNLIWDESPLARGAAATGATLLMALLGINAYYLGVNPREERRFGIARDVRVFLCRHGLRMKWGRWLDPTGSGHRDDEANRWALSLFLRLCRLPFLVLISLPALFPRVFAFVPWNAPEARIGPITLGGNARGDVVAYGWGLFVWTLGLGMGILVVKLALRISAVMSNFREWAAAPPAVPEASPPRRLAAGVAGRVRMGGFHQYLLIVVVVYGFLGLSSSGLGMTRGLAWLLLLASSLPQLAATYVLLRRGWASAEDYTASWTVCVLVLACGAPLLWTGWRVPAAFAIFALLGLLAAVHAIFERREFGLVYVVAGGALATLASSAAWRLATGEGGVARDGLAIAALGSAFAFGCLSRGVRGFETRGGDFPIKALAVAGLLHAALVLASSRFEAVELPALTLAAAFWLVACLAAVPARVVGKDAEDLAGLQRRRWILLTVAAGLWILLVNYDPFKERFDELSYPPTTERLSSRIKRVYPYRVLNAADPAKVERGEDQGLVENFEALEAWRNRVAPAAKGGGRKDKPKLVILCVSGGAIRSAYWSATVLTRLEKSPAADRDDPGIDGFHDHVRLITGASGGMVGMAYYEAALLARAQAATPGAPFWFDLDGIRLKSLNGVAGFIALQAPWRMLLPRLPEAAAYDRGLVLEDDWSALRKIKFADLRELERGGRIPSMIFSPMIVDDGRRLLISNLDLNSHMRADRPHEKGEDARQDRVLREWSIPTSRQDDLDNDNDGYSRNQFSISALELFKMVPDSKRLSLATAARMSATFPFVSPAVNLPTDPPLRVVDAGYYDNYGVHLANAWILQNRDWLLENTSGILVVQTRDSVSKRERLGVPSESAGFLDRVFRGTRLLSSVGEAVMHARSSTNAFRNDQEFVAVNEVFRKMGARDGFVATAVFENTAYLSTTGDGATAAAGDAWPGLGDDLPDAIAGEVPMSWYLTGNERRAIEQAIPRPPGDQDYARILRGFHERRHYFLDAAAKPGAGLEAAELRPLRRAMSFAMLIGSEGRRFQAPDDFDIGRARDAYRRFAALAELLTAIPLDKVAASRGVRPSRERIDELGRSLITWSKEPEVARTMYERYFKRDARPIRAQLNADRDELGRIIVDAVNGPEFAGLDMKNVLLFAHSEWLNAQAGFEPNLAVAAQGVSQVDPGIRRIYYSREFERAMNYYRLQAVSAWWKHDHSRAEPGPEPKPEGYDRHGNLADRASAGRDGDHPGGPGGEPLPLPRVP